MSTLIVGSEGAQGRRYRSILKFLSIPYLCTDEKYPTPELSRNFKAVIIATPTDTHLEVIRKYLPYGCPILCEKPIAKNAKDVEQIFTEAENAKVPLSMVMQYRQLVPTSQISRAVSYYDYFRHGNDGLTWDCLQIIALARGEIKLSELSPVWHCGINGFDLRISDMDRAYVQEIKDWYLRIPHEKPAEVIQIHQKVEAYARKP